MHKSFADWYRITSIDFREELLKKRWVGIEKFVKSSGLQMALEVVRLFHTKPFKDNDFIDKYREAFKKADSTFPMRDNDLELQVLAGASIVHHLDTSHKYATEVALATVCANYTRVASHVVFPEIINIARNYLSEQSINLRSRYKLSRVKISKINNMDKLMKDLTKACQANTLPNTAPPLKESFMKLNTAIKELVDSTNKTLIEVNEYLKLQQEESNILWWLFGGYSNDLECRMADLKVATVCLVAGKELADLTVLVPGPVAVDAFLDKMIRTSIKVLPESIALKDAVNASPIEWRKKWINTKDFGIVEDMCPVHYAVKKSLETGGNSAWVISFEENMKTKADIPVYPLKLALQVYLENLLIESLT